MMTDLNWNEFCELYYDSAKEYAEIHLQRLRKKIGDFDKRVDLDYVKDAAVLSSLEKTFAHFDSKRGAKITTYLSTLVHNEIVDEVAKETKSASLQQDIDDLKAAIREYGNDNSAEARAQLIPRLKAAIARLSPSDQVILNYYLQDKSSYIAKSSEILGISESYVSVRRNRILKLLPKLMAMKRSDYLQFCYEYDGEALAGKVEGAPVLKLRPNPILPSLSLNVMAERLLTLL
jgi:RNA polymerase sigma factor (sigma-70 family)